MAEPKFGNCRDCVCWMRRLVAPGDKEGKRLGECQRHPMPLAKKRHQGCWDFIPKPLPSPPETDNG